MDKQALVELKKQLEKRKNDLIKQLKGVGTQTEGAEINFDATFPQYGDSLEDNAVEVADYAKNLSVEKELERDLRDVEKALKKMAAGTYGVCNYCGKEIETARLKIRPESSSCVACKKAITGKK